MNTGAGDYRVRGLAALAAMLPGLLLLWYVPPVQAQSEVAGGRITVNTAEDELDANRQCSLREAMEAANTNTPVDRCAAGSSEREDRIAFDLGKNATVTLDPTLGQLTVTDPSGLRIDGAKKEVTVSGGDQTQVFEVSSGAELEVKDLTVANGSADQGGGLSNSGTVMVTDSTFSDNSANAGGGIINDGGTLTVNGSTVSGNTAALFSGGIRNLNGTLEVNASTLSNNTAGDDGGGLSNAGSGSTATVIDSTFSNNSAPDSFFNFGGGILNIATLTVINSTFSENSASQGGGIFNTGVATLRNTIVTYSPSGGNCSGPIADEGYNISDDSSCAFTAEGSLNDTDPRLDPDGLQDNGGPTQTIAPGERVWR